MAFSFIAVEDIYRTYPEEAYNKLINNDTTIAEQEEEKVIELVKNHLSTRFDMDTVFSAPAGSNYRMLVSVMVDIMIYNLLARLNNADIPVIRKERYDGNDPRQIGGAIRWLKDANKGNIDPLLPLNEDNQEDQTGNVRVYGQASDVTDEKNVF